MVSDLPQPRGEIPIVFQASPREWFGPITRHLAEGVIILEHDQVQLCNPAAQAFLPNAENALLGRHRSAILAPTPPLPAAGERIAFAARDITGQQPGPLLHGLACGLEDGFEVWVVQANQSLNQLGSLAAGLLHNLAGPLSTIRSTVELLERHLSPLLGQAPPPQLNLAAWPASLQRGMDRILEQVDQITDAARDLLAKLRDEAGLRYTPLDLNQIIWREVKALDNDPFFKHQVDKELDLAEDLPEFWGLYSDFAQSFRNLLRNSMQAMQDTPERRLRVASALEPDQIVLTFADTGRGVPPEVMEHIFEPFFTTNRAAAQCSGLGLYSLQQLLRPYQAAYQVESRPGRTIFRLRIPLGQPRG